MNVCTECLGNSSNCCFSLYQSGGPTNKSKVEFVRIFSIYVINKVPWLQVHHINVLLSTVKWQAGDKLCFLQLLFSCYKHIRTIAFFVFTNICLSFNLLFSICMMVQYLLSNVLQIFWLCLPQIFWLCIPNFDLMAIMTDMLLRFIKTL